MGRSVNFHITVFGRVQGVGYRAFVLRSAKSLSISGYVKNNTDGSVFIEAEGEEIELQKFIAICKSGPGWAHIESLNYTEYPVQDHTSFRVKY